MRFFTRDEIRDLAISILTVALMLSYPDIEQTFFLSLLVAFVVFFLHEVGHKFAANKLGCIATYKLWASGLIAGLLSMILKPFANIVFIAPGYVEVVPYSFGRLGFKVVQLTPRDYGMIAFAGVGLNVLFAVVFRLFPGEIFQMLSYTSALLSIFNLLPIKPLDGSDIILWKSWLWMFLMFIGILALVL